MFRRSFRPLLLLALPLVAALGACQEDLDTGASCPLLCPGQEIVIRDTVVDGVLVIDSTIAGFPIQGLENPLLLSARGDTLDVRTIVRFDTLRRLYQPVGVDTLEPVTYVDSAFLSLRLYRAGFKIPGQFFVEAYDVTDTTLVDTLPNTLLPLFTPANLLGAYRVDSASFVDSSRIRIPIDSAKLRAIITEPGRRLRVGLIVRSSESAQFRLTPYSPGGDGPSLEYSVSPDTTVARVVGLEPSSSTPRSPSFVAGDIVDYQMVVDAPTIAAPGTFAFGGLPASRAYLRFELPSWLTDSVGILRARLELTQDPLRGPSDADSIQMQVHLVVANGTVTDLRRAATLLTAGNLFTSVLVTTPADSGVKTVEINALFRQWASIRGLVDVPNAIVLRSNTEGASPLAVRFFSMRAADPSVRPRLRVTYTPAKVFGRP